MDDMVPVQNQPAQPIERWVAELAYLDYHARFPNQSLDRLLERGGFGQNELIDHLSRVATIAQAEARRLQVQLAYAREMREASYKAGRINVANSWLPIVEALNKLESAFTSVRGDYTAALEELLDLWAKVP